MSEPVTESIVTHTIAPEVSNGFEILQFVVANAFTIVGGAFSVAFMIVVFFIFVKALKGSNLQDLFEGVAKKQLSMTKFWTNVAYFSATVAFLAANLISKSSGDGMVMIWLIYLGTVGANAIASKWLALKYSGDATTSPKE